MKVRAVALASDHAGFEMKQVVMEWLDEHNIPYTDFGCFTPERCDYPDFAHPMALAIEAGKFPLGVAVCGSGNGINIALNKHLGIRSALCWEPELGVLARAHNDANVCALPGRFISPEVARQILQAFFSTSFEGGRHQERVYKISHF